MKSVIVALVALTSINAFAGYTTVTVCNGGESGQECSKVTYEVRRGKMVVAADQHLNSEAQVEVPAQSSSAILQKIGKALSFGSSPAFPGTEAP
jgi:hypothetical protein